MRLRYAPNSPYVRKVLIVAIEVGIDGRIERIPTNTTPLEADIGLTQENPLAKIPSLTLEDGVTLFDSRVICEYLDSLGERDTVFPAPGPARWAALRHQALADGILEAVTACRYETVFRPVDKHWQPWMDGQMRKARQGLDALESGCDSLGGALDIGQIAAACTLGWLDIRLEEGWRSDRPALSDWFDAFSRRPSMQATVPPG